MAFWLTTTRSLSLFACFIVSAPSALTQDKSPSAPLLAQVTFYSNRSFWKTALPGYKHGEFVGLIFDDDRQLARMKPGHFVTFNLPPGAHVFSANVWLIPSPQGGAHLKTVLEAGKHYYIGTYFESVGLISVPHLEQASCQQAQKSAGGAKPLSIRDIEEKSVPSASEDFLPCP